MAFWALFSPVCGWLCNKPGIWWWDHWDEVQTWIWTLTAHDRSNTIGSHATALLMCFYISSSQMVCEATFNSSIVLGFDTFPLWRPDVIVQCVQIWWVLGVTDSSQWTQDSLLAASIVWHVPCEPRRHLAGGWSLECLCDCQLQSFHYTEALKLVLKFYILWVTW